MLHLLLHTAIVATGFIVRFNDFAPQPVAISLSERKPWTNR